MCRGGLHFSMYKRGELDEMHEKHTCMNFAICIKFLGLILVSSVYEFNILLQYCGIFIVQRHEECLGKVG
jgi:hypothetical protein